MSSAPSVPEGLLETTSFAVASAVRSSRAVVLEKRPEKRSEGSTRPSVSAAILAAPFAENTALAVAAQVAGAISDDQTSASAVAKVAAAADRVPPASAGSASDFVPSSPSLALAGTAA